MPGDFFDDPSAGAPPPSAPAPSGGGGDFFGGGGGAAPAGQGRAQIPYVNIKGMHAQFPNVDQPGELKLDQDLSHASEDLRARLADLNAAVTAQQKRDQNTSLMDKVIGHAVGIYYGRDPINDPLAGEKGSIWRQHRQYQPGAGYPVERGEVFANAGSSRQAVQAWIMAAAKTRNYKALTDVQNHIPYETDTDELHQKKMAFWHHRLAEVDAELKQRGVDVPAPPLAPSAGGEEGPSTITAPPPFHVKAQRMVGSTRLYEDDKGSYWYYDKGWVKYGG